MHLNDFSGQIIDSAVKVHSKLGPGLLESVYETVLAFELKQRGYRVERQVPVSILYERIRFDEGFRIDLLIEDKVIVELKSVETIIRLHKKQLLTYLRLLSKQLGLLLNFNVDLMKDGITRIVNGISEC